MKSMLSDEKWISFALVVLLVLFVNPLGFWMPTMAQMALLAGIIALFFAYTAFIWKEKVGDERESLHRYISARFAYLSGGIVLLLAMTVQAFMHKSDPWISIALGVMVIAKIIGRVYAGRNH